MKNNKFIVYADMNCPFCFTLHERLLEQGYLDSVDWRPVEHAPSISYDESDLQAQAELTAEVNRVREVADDINIIIPAGRPNSAEAIRQLQAAARLDPIKAGIFRTLIYRALWVEGKDFSDPELLALLREKADLPDLVAQQDDNVIAQWQQEWEEGDFSRNIPVLVTGDGNKLLGLPNPEVIGAFMSGNENFMGFDEGDFCYLKPREKVLIVSDDTDVMDSFAETLRSEYAIEFAQYGDAAYQSCISSNPPDLVLIDIDVQDPCGFTTCSNIKDDPAYQNTAIIMFSHDRTVKDEVKAFDSGAADYIPLPCAPEVLLARVRVLLRLKRTTDLLEQYSRLDGLTEIPNRREFDRMFEKEWRRAMRSREPLSLFLIDVDFFKLYNDNYGHMDGDHCLKKVSQVLEQTIRRPHDFVARYGGEEFAIILPETSLEYARHVAENLRHAIHIMNIPHSHSKVADHITFSIGMSATIPDIHTSPKKLIDAADMALYKAKENGRDTAYFVDCDDSDPMTD